MKLLVINNIAAGLGDGAIFDFVRNYSSDNDEVVIRSTDGTTDLRMFLYDAENYDLVVASGGDGTVSTISYLLADTAIPVLPFPAGTANLLTLNLQSPTDVHAIAEMAKQAKVLDFDIGEIEFPSGIRKGFTLMAGAGYDATIMEEAEDGKKFLGQMAYFTSAFTNSNPQFADFEIELDGEAVKSSGVGILLINFSKIQFDISIVHENSPRDGYFDVVVLRTKDAFGLVPALIAAMLDNMGEYPDRTNAFEIFRAKVAKVSADPALKVQFDGEVSDLTTPFTARILPKAARFIVSDNCIKAYGGSADAE